MSDIDTALLDSNAKTVIAEILNIDDVDVLNALLDSEKNDFEKPRRTILKALEARIAEVAVGSDDDSDDGLVLKAGDAEGDESAASAEGDESAESAEGDEKSDPTVGPAKLGKTARAVYDFIREQTNPVGDDFEPVEVVYPTAGDVADGIGVKTGQVRSICRTLRERNLVGLEMPATPEDRTFRYNIVGGSELRIADGDAERALRKSGSTGKARENAEPMPEEDYIPAAMKIGVVDRLIVRWSGTTHRERRAIDKEHGEGASKDLGLWETRTVVVDGDSVTGTAKDIVKALRALRNSLMSDASLQASQALEEAAMLVEVKVDGESDDSADSDSDSDDEE